MSILPLPEHAFIAGDRGELLLVVNVLSFDHAEEPALLVSREDAAAYLRRGQEQIYEILEINEDLLSKLRAQDDIVVVEMLGDKVINSYDAPCGILEVEEQARVG